ncbi:MAG: hypothetical protein RIC35_09590 [Marinoscillum sp.]
MKRLFISFCILNTLALLTSCYSTEEYFVGTPPNPLDNAKSVELINNQYKIHSTVFYRDFQEALGVSTTGTLVYDHIKVKADGSLYIMGSKQENASATSERFEFQTDNNLSNLSKVNSLTTITLDQKENHYTGPDNEYIFLDSYLNNDKAFIDIVKNGNTVGTVQDYFAYYIEEDYYDGPYQPNWYLDANDQFYDFKPEVVSNFGDGIVRINKPNASSISEYWIFNPSVNYTSRFPAVIIGETPYWFLINSSTNSPLEIYRGNSTIVFQDAQNIQYGYDLIGTSSSNCDCSYYAYRWVSDDVNAYILVYGGNKFRLIKFSSASNTASVVSEFQADFTKSYVQDFDVKVKLLKSGTAYVMVRDGNNGPSAADGSHYYEFLKISEVESKSYGVISTNDFDSNITYNYHDFYIVNDEPVIWFSSGSGSDYRDQLLIVSPK